MQDGKPVDVFYVFHVRIVVASCRVFASILFMVHLVHPLPDGCDRASSAALGMEAPVAFFSFPRKDWRWRRLIAGSKVP